MKIKLPDKIDNLFNLFKSRNAELFLVGGALRDLAIQQYNNSKTNINNIHDYDFATNLTPHEMKNIFPEYKFIETGIKHGTLTMVFQNDFFEITTYRAEETYSDGRRPDDVEFVTSIQEDLSRRDFSINAMAYNPYIGLLDPYYAIQDIKDGILRCVGKASDRLHEDYLRALRALRFSAKYGFILDDELALTILQQASLIHNISHERIRTEIEKMLLDQQNGAISAVDYMTLNVLFCKRHSLTLPKENTLINQIRQLDNINLWTLWAVYLYDYNFDSAKEVQCVLKVSKKAATTIYKIINALRYFNFMQYQIKQYGDYTLSELRTEIKLMLQTFELFSVNSAVEVIININPKFGYLFYHVLRDINSLNEPYCIQDLAINGNDIKEYFKDNIEGITIGTLLHYCLGAILLHPEKNNRKTLLKEIDKIYVS